MATYRTVFDSIDYHCPDDVITCHIWPEDEVALDAGQGEAWGFGENDAVPCNETWHVRSLGGTRGHVVCVPCAEDFWSLEDFLPQGWDLLILHGHALIDNYEAA